MFSNAYQSGFISIFYSCGSNPLSLWDKQVKNGHIRRVVDDEVKSLVLEISGTNVATTYITCPIQPRASLGVKLPFLVMVIKNMKKYFTFEIQILDRLPAKPVLADSKPVGCSPYRPLQVKEAASTTGIEETSTRPRCGCVEETPIHFLGQSEAYGRLRYDVSDTNDKDMRRRFRVSNFQSATKVRPFCTTMPIGLNSGWNQVQFNLADFTKRAYGSIYMETIRVQIHANVRIRRIYFSDTLYSDDELPNEFKLFAPSDKVKDKKGKEGPDKAEGILFINFLLCALNRLGFFLLK
ncbi:hypothetical protein NQ317_015698 [Molorchus minor]|uniref:CFA20 domain-containing protein n=1 Tax=Molorchus minor TaxID=1323400 RepID=A0ABQ9J3I6_9CUCU|nr:hypothetical protein NQ317_015698 [Molorchus minor]